MNIEGLSVYMNGGSGVEIRAKLSQKYNCAEFRLSAEPQPIFISPWIQFEPSTMMNERHQIATEIARRATVHDSLVQEVARLQERLEEERQAYDRKSKTLDTTFRMWKEDRKKAGFPDDFSDIAEWPPEMMSNYR